jgi:carboxyl-terminal processing protease
MKGKPVFLPALILLMSLTLSACIGLLPLEEEPVTGDFGPQYSLQEHQMRTFESLWTQFQENYIYFETANVDWEEIRDTYQMRIEDGLTSEEFADLLRELETDLPAGSLLYQSRAERIETDITDTSTYGGIGAFVDFNPEPVPHIVILDVMEGSPAEKAGLQDHDSILIIDGQPVLLEEGIDAVRRVRGQAGTTVTLTVKTPGKPERVVNITRARLTATAKLEAREIEGYGYMLFPPIAYTGLIDDFLSNLQTFTSNKTLPGLILDLRIAGSTQGWPIENMLVMFHDGAVGDFYDRRGEQSANVTGQDVFGSQTVPLVILVGKNTSGSPEIFAAVLQLYKRAVVLGSTTPGEVESTGSFYLPDGSRILVQIGSFRLPNGEIVGINGVKPDVPIDADWDEILPGADPVLEKAIELLGEKK